MFPRKRRPHHLTSRSAKTEPAENPNGTGQAPLSFCSASRASWICAAVEAGLSRTALGGGDCGQVGDAQASVCEVQQRSEELLVELLELRAAVVHGQDVEGGRDRGGVTLLVEDRAHIRRDREVAVQRGLVEVDLALAAVLALPVRRVPDSSGGARMRTFAAADAAPESSSADATRSCRCRRRRTCASGRSSGCAAGSSGSGPGR